MRTGLILAFWCLLALPGAARAHALLESATPAVGSTLVAAPKEVLLRFSGAIEAGFSRIELHDAAGSLVATAPAEGAGLGALRVALPELGPGQYEVIWHVTSIDGHMTQGRFRFWVGK